MRTRIMSFVKEHGLLSGLVSNIVTFLLGYLFSGVVSSQVVATHYISIDSFDGLINKHFVSTGLASEDVLQIDDVDEQLSIISSDFNGYKSELAKVNITLEDILFADDIASDIAKNMSAEEKALEIKHTIDDLTSKSAMVDSLTEDVERLKAENSILDDQTTAEIKATTLVVDGEQIDTDIPDSFAIIGGHNFYSESLLNTFLDKPLSFNSKESLICYGVEKPEKIVFSNQLISDIRGFVEYTVGNGKSFKMGTDSYDNGLVKDNSDSAFFYANLKREFSEISFKVGHIDGTALEPATISVYTKIGNQQYRLQETIDLTHDMISDEKRVPLSYADGLQLVIDGPYYADYALADIYLYR